MTKTEKIPPLQFLFAIIAFIQGASLLTKFSLAISQRDTWICVINAFALTTFVILIYGVLINKFPGMTIIEINDAVFGKIVGKIISLLYLYFFLSLTTLNIRNVCSFTLHNVLPETPLSIIVITFVFVCAYIVRKGVHAMMSYGFLVVIAVSIVTALNTILLLKEMSFDNFLPVLSLSVKDYIQSTHTISAISFGEIFIFFMLMPNLTKPKSGKKMMLWGLLFGALTLMMVVLRDVAVLGESVSFLTMQTYETIKLLKVGDIITRSEILYATMLITLQIFKSSIMFYATVKAITQIFNLKGYKYITYALGTIITAYSLFVHPTYFESAYWGASTAAFFSATFDILFPIITVIVMLLRKNSIDAKLKEANAT